MARLRTAADREYNNSERGKAARKKYLASPKGRAMLRAKGIRFRKSQKYREWITKNKSNPELQARLKRYAAAWRSSKKGNRSTLWLSAKRHAAQRGLEFKISKEDIEIPDICPLLGLRLIPGSEDIWTSPSLDRKDSKKGYIPGNVWVVSRRANLLKSDAKISELILLVRSMKKYHLGGWHG